MTEFLLIADLIALFVVLVLLAINLYKQNQNLKIERPKSIWKHIGRGFLAKAPEPEGPTRLDEIESRLIYLENKERARNHRKK